MTTTPARPDAGALPAKRPVGRPRDAAVDGPILEAALAEVAESGIAHFSIPSVARRVGVARGTVDLRWPDKEQLIAAALETTALGFSVPETGTMRGDVTELARQWADVLRDGRVARVIHRLRAESDDFPALFDRYARTVGEPAVELAVRIVRGIQERGDAEGSLSADAVVRCMIGSFLTPPRPGTITPEYEQAVVETVVAALTPRRRPA